MLASTVKCEGGVLHNGPVLISVHRGRCIDARGREEFDKEGRISLLLGIGVWIFAWVKAVDSGASLGSWSGQQAPSHIMEFPPMSP